MSERKMYEVAIRMLGLVLLPRAIASLTLAIQTLVAQGNQPYGLGYVSSAVIAFLVFFAASVGLIALAPRLSEFLSTAELSPLRTEGMNQSSYLHLGITLIGVYVLAMGLVLLVSYFLDLLRVRIVSVGESTYRMTMQPLTATVQIVIGLALVFHERLFRSGRHLQNESPKSQEMDKDETPSQRNELHDGGGHNSGGVKAP